MLFYVFFHITQICEMIAFSGNVLLETMCFVVFILLIEKICKFEHPRTVLQLNF